MIIGRNEGTRLDACLESLLSGRNMPQFPASCDASFAGGNVAPVLVYVDSGSTDGSVSLAKSKGVEVVELDPCRPFSAARARNEGFSRIEQIHPDARYVQFVDGDCVVNPDWFASATQYLDDQQVCAAVCGRLREQFPRRNIYHRLCDMEWNMPPGDAKSCGGVAMYRASVFRQ
ncbi:MAG TPA: glycosyltransferase family A protein, partial [Phycisphaerae bacterium]